MGRSSSGGDGTAINGTVNFADGYVHLTRAGSDENTIKAMEWTGGPNGFPQGEKWVKIQPMRVNGVTVTPAVSTIKPGGTVNLAARITVLNPTGVGPLNVTKGAAWTVTGGKSYTVSDGKFTVKADETAKSLTVTAKYGADTGSASVAVEQTTPQEQPVGIVEIGGTSVTLPAGGAATPNQDGTMTVSSGSFVTSPGGLSLTVNSEAAVDKNGSVTLSGNGSIIIRGTIVTVPAKGGTITSNGDGTLSIPSGSVVTDKNGKRISVSPRGGTLSRDGAYEDNPDPVFSSGPSTYPPIIPQPDNGHVSVSPRSPKKGDTVTVALTPNGNYEAGSVAVKDSGGSKLEVWDNHDGTYSFTQPGEAVTVEATFVPRSQAMPFFDVWPDDWCYDAVCYVDSRGIMGGYSDGTLRPKGQTTRAQAAAMLMRFCENG